MTQKKRDINITVFTGNLTKDPEDVPTESGVTVCRLRVASNERIRRGEEWEDHTNYFDVVVFGNQAQNCLDYLARGRPVAVEGRNRFHEWESEDGRRSRIETVAQHVQFLGSPPTQTQGGENGSALPEAYFTSSDGGGAGGEDDLPF